MKTVARMPPLDDEILLNAYLDGELDDAAASALENRLHAEPALKLIYDRLEALRRVIAANIAKDRASENLRAKIAAIAEPKAQTSRSRPARLYDFRQLAASVLVAAVLASSATTYISRYDRLSDTTALIAAHQHALLALSPVEVVSEDRHTVKPWFDNHLALSPRVIDLSSAGFTLVGGRADVIAGKALPVMVYRIRGHIIGLVATPKPGSADDSRDVVRDHRDGYQVLTWPGRDFVYSAISDVAESDLMNFVARWRSEAKTN